MEYHVIDFIAGLIFLTFTLMGWILLINQSVRIT